MRLAASLWSVVLFGASFWASPSLAAELSVERPAAILPELAESIEGVVAGIDTLPAERRRLLDQMVDDARARLAAGKPVRWNFICTHNSRRSHLAQVWAQTAAAYYGLTGIETYSGGTEVTACNPRTVAALRRAGFKVAALGEGENPRYELTFAADRPPLQAWSKRYDDPANPATDFAALLCCDEADQQCPTVPGADLRLSLHYDDPKHADGTPQEAWVYDQRCREIAREMFYVLSRLHTNPAEKRR